MRVWIVNPFDNLPLEGYRPLRYWTMAEEFTRAGDDVTLFTSGFSHVNKRRRVFLPGYAPPPFRLEVVESPPYKSNVSLRRVLAHVKWAKAWRERAEGAGENPDAIIVSSPPLSAVREAEKFAALHGSKVIVDVQDLWPETFERVVPRWLLAPLRRFAANNYRAADAVTAVSERFVSRVRECGCKRPARLFYHGIDMSAPYSPPPERNDGTMRVAYAGSLGRTYDLASAIEAAKLDGAIRLEIAGRGEQEEKLKVLASTLGVEDRVSFRGYLGEKDLGRMLSSCDAALVPMSPDSCVGVPYKLADYARAGLPVASSLGGECDRLLARHGAGRHYRSGDPASLATALKSIAADLSAMRLSSRRMAEEEFDSVKIYSSMRRYVKDVVDDARFID